MQKHWNRSRKRPKSKSANYSISIRVCVWNVCIAWLIIAWDTKKREIRRNNDILIRKLGVTSKQKVSQWNTKQWEKNKTQNLQLRQKLVVVKEIFDYVNYTTTTSVVILINTHLVTCLAAARQSLVKRRKHNYDLDSFTYLVPNSQVILGLTQSPNEEHFIKS